MATKTVIRLVDDLDGSDAERTVKFGLDGVQYEIDLKDDHVRALQESMAEWVGHARKVGGSPARRGRSAASTSSSGLDAKAVRAWAAAKGMSVPSRGRVPKTVLEQYQAEHPA